MILLISINCKIKRRPTFFHFNFMKPSELDSSRHHPTKPTTDPLFCLQEKGGKLSNVSRFLRMLTMFTFTGVKFNALNHFDNLIENF